MEKGPGLEGGEYKVISMGSAKINPRKKEASFRGRGSNYGIGVDKDYLDDIKSSKPDWDFV